MENAPVHGDLELTQREVAELSERLAEAKRIVQQWSEASVSLARSAATERANNQSMGRGFFGAIFGSKVRSTLRSAAAASNASIAKQVAAKRLQNAERKREAQDLVRRVQAALTDAKARLKTLNAETKTSRGSKSAGSDPIAMLQRLKEAHANGLLTDAEYEEKRKALVSKI